MVRVLLTIPRMTSLHQYHHGKVQKVSHALEDYILKIMIHFHFFKIMKIIQVLFKYEKYNKNSYL